jgi:hypothetical protein
LINDIDNFKGKPLIHEIDLSSYFFTRKAQIEGESSFYEGRQNSHLSPLKEKRELSMSEIIESLYRDKRHSKFLDPKIIKRN